MSDTGINTVALQASLQQFAEAIGIGLGIATERIAFAIHSGDTNFSGVVERTPVDTGRARAGWDVSIGAPSEYLPPEGLTDVPIFPASLQIDGTEPVFITNNIVYINALENGHSKRSPQGMVAITVAAAEAQIDSILSGIQEEAGG